MTHKVPSPRATDRESVTPCNAPPRQHGDRNNPGTIDTFEQEKMGLAAKE